VLQDNLTKSEWERAHKRLQSGVCPPYTTVYRMSQICGQYFDMMDKVKKNVDEITEGVTGGEWTPEEQAEIETSDVNELEKSEDA